MSTSQGVFDKERQFLEQMISLIQAPGSDNQELITAFPLLCQKYKTLLDEIRVLTKVSDRLQAKLQTSNQDLRNNSEALELATQKAEAARMRAESSEKFKEQFLANMSHEIRTPMNAVLGMTRLLLNTQLDELQKKYMEAIKQSSENLLVIINDILDLSKIEAGRMEFETIPFQLTEVCRGIKDTLKFRVDEKGIELILDMDPQMPAWLTGDPVRLSQILLNLTGNAVKFTEKGSVSIRSKWKKNDEGTEVVYIEVQDTGIGIPEDRQQAVFESYSQAGTDTNRKFGGTGLGLTISKQLVEQQKGKIGLFSTLGKGTTFWFEIPFPEAQEPGMDTHLPESVDEFASKLENLRVLLVEDNAFNQMVAVDTLKELIPSIQIEVSENGQEAVDYLSEHNVDIVLMDVNMPIMDGFEATRLLRAREKNSARHLAILAMTAGVTKPEIDACIVAGMDDVIGKPFENIELLKKIFTLRQKYKSGMKHMQENPALLLKGKRILITDDNAFNRMVAEDTLKSLLPDTLFEQAEDGEQMLSMHQKKPFDIILTDLNMPKMDGWQATREIRKHKDSLISKTIIMAMTANDSVSEKEQCLTIGMNGYVSKPFDPDKLCHTLVNLVFQPNSDTFV